MKRANIPAICTKEGLWLDATELTEFEENFEVVDSENWQGIDVRSMSNESILKLCSDWQHFAAQAEEAEFLIWVANICGQDAYFNMTFDECVNRLEEQLFGCFDNKEELAIHYWEQGFSRYDDDIVFRYVDWGKYYKDIVREDLICHEVGMHDLYSEIGVTQIIAFKKWD